jgi:hypothetical protein
MIQNFCSIDHPKLQRVQLSFQLIFIGKIMKKLIKLVFIKKMENKKKNHFSKFQQKNVKIQVYPY